MFYLAFAALLTKSFAISVRQGVGERLQAAAAADKQTFTATLAQVAQRCAQVNMSKDIALLPGHSSWLGQGGWWADGFSQDSPKVASWSLNFAGPSWSMVSIADKASKRAVQVMELTEQEMKDKFKWTTGPPPSWLVERERRLQTAMATQIFEVNTTIVNPLENDPRTVKYQPSVHMLEDTTPPSFLALADCEGQLMFVVNLHEIAGSLVAEKTVGSIVIFDTAGNIVAYSLRDPLLNQYKILEPVSNVLLATAESPALGLNFTKQDDPKDAYKGNVQPFGLHIEDNGYVNSSRLLDEDLRWVLVAAVQARALRDAHFGWKPWLPSALIWVFWSGVTLLIVIALATLIIVLVRRYTRNNKAARGAPTPWTFVANPVGQVARANPVGPSIQAAPTPTESRNFWLRMEAPAVGLQAGLRPA